MIRVIAVLALIGLAILGLWLDYKEKSTNPNDRPYDHEEEE